MMLLTYTAVGIYTILLTYLHKFYYVVYKFINKNNYHSKNMSLNHSQLYIYKNKNYNKIYINIKFMIIIQI